MNLETQSKLQILENLDKLSNIVGDLNNYEIKNVNVDVVLVEDQIYAELDLDSEGVIEQLINFRDNGITVESAANFSKFVIVVQKDETLKGYWPYKRIEHYTLSVEDAQKILNESITKAAFKYQEALLYSKLVQRQIVLHNTTYAGTINPGLPAQLLEVAEEFYESSRCW